MRLLAVLFGGACAGLAGAYLSLAYTPFWSPGMTAGRGWIALALVVFASWRPWRVLAGALLFGGATVLQLHAQAFGIGLPGQLLSAVPYLATILALVLLSLRSRRGAARPPCWGRLRAGPLTRRSERRGLARPDAAERLLDASGCDGPGTCMTDAHDWLKARCRRRP